MTNNVINLSDYRRRRQVVDTTRNWDFPLLRIRNTLDMIDKLRKQEGIEE